MNDGGEGSLGGALKKMVSTKEPRRTVEEVSDELLLYNERRRSIIQFLILRPGSTIGSVSKDLGGGTSNLKWHLEKMRRKGLVDIVIYEGRPCCIPGEFAPEGKWRERLCALFFRNHGVILRHVANAPGIHTARLGSETGFSPNTVRKGIGRLAAAGLVSHRKDGNRMRHFITPVLAGMVENSKEWYRNYTALLVKIMRSERMEVSTSIGREGGMEISFAAGEDTGTLTVPASLEW